ncbi:MAG: hypothetical protein HY329_13020 [Chloroflexi bacterium]|nr:hypothetical protein [Chloroflexota bacterium]
MRLPSPTARAMWSRARRYRVAAGGRFEARSAAIIIRSNESGPTKEAPPIGSLLIAWQSPTPETATIYRLQWDPESGGSERELWRALDVLAGIGGD